MAPQVLFSCSCCCMHWLCSFPKRFGLVLFVCVKPLLQDYSFRLIPPDCALFCLAAQAGFNQSLTWQAVAIWSSVVSCFIHHCQLDRNADVSHIAPDLNPFLESLLLVTMGNQRWSSLVSCSTTPRVFLTGRTLTHCVMTHETSQKGVQVSWASMVLVEKLLYLTMIQQMHFYNLPGATESLERLLPLASQWCLIAEQHWRGIAQTVFIWVKQNL
jgi:hypothetical protein